MRFAVERLEGIFDSLDYHVAVYDHEWRYTYVNREAARILGRSPGELLGRSIWELFPDAIGNQYHQELHKAAASGRIVHSEFFYAPFARWFENHIYPITDGVLVLSRDITEKRQAAEALRRHDTMLRLAQRAGGVGTFEWNFAHGVVEGSAELFRMLGLPESQGSISVEEWSRFVHPLDRDDVMAHLERVTSGEDAPAADYRVVAADGRVRWLTYTGQMHRTASGELRMLGTVVDITVRKQLERELRERAEELAEANRLKDEFLATVSHELRTPLNVIRGRAAMLGGASDRAAVERAAEIIDRNSALLEKLVDDLLDISRITLGQFRLECTPVSLGAVVDAVMQAVHSTAEAKRIALAADVPAALPLVWGDGMRLQQVVWNLLANAVKFTPPGGNVRVTAAAEAETVLLSVHDSGEGIPADLLPRVFEMFWQAEPTATRRHGGLGLGLSIARRLVELHGGDIRASSPGPQQGATFTVRLRAATVAQLHASGEPIG